MDLMRPFMVVWNEVMIIAPI